jgi:hypothetical protein
VFKNLRHKSVLRDCIRVLWFLLFDLFSARFPYYLQHFGAGSCHFNCLRKVLELELLIFHVHHLGGICKGCRFNGICSTFEFEYFIFGFRVSLGVLFGFKLF